MMEEVAQWRSHRHSFLLLQMSYDLQIEQPNYQTAASSQPWCLPLPDTADEDGASADHELPFPTCIGTELAASFHPIPEPIIAS